MNLVSIDPATGEAVFSHTAWSATRAANACALAAAAQPAWAKRPVAERAEVLRQVSRLLRRDTRAHAYLIAREMGKPIREARDEVEKCALACEWVATHGPAHLVQRVVRTDASHAEIRFEPLGAILAVAPWNFPYWQVIRAAAPALLAGNSVLLKHASNVPGCAHALENLFRDAGLPPHLFCWLPIEPAMAESLIGCASVAAVTLTGNPNARRELAAACGRHLKPCALEFDGGNPYVVLGDADLELAVEASVRGRMVHGGQGCSGAKRWIVVAGLYKAFERRAMEALSALRVGSPLDERTEIGPLARADLRAVVHDQVERSVAAGAVCRLGGRVASLDGAWYPPTLIADVRPGMAVFDEDVCGPVAALVRAEDDDEAFSLAARATFGRGAAVFTRDVGRGVALARTRMVARSVFVNDAVRSDPRWPFGAVRDGGLGSELGPFGTRSFVQVKTVVVR